MIEFVHPEVFLLAAPTILLLRRGFASRPSIAVLRFALLLATLGVLAEPYLTTGTAGRDLILVVDRSLSVPDAAADRVQELAEIVRGQRQDGDRIGLIAFGRDAAVEAAQSADFRYAPPSQPIDRDGTDLTQAIDRALAVIPPGRRGSILLVSDGEDTGASPLASARAALRRGVRIDAVVLRREGGEDVAVEEVAVPSEVGVNEPFQFSAWVRCDRPQRAAPFRLLRDGVVIAEGTRDLQVGLNRLLFRDRHAEQGIHRYEVEVAGAADRVVENNRAQAVIRVVGPDRVLCVSQRGQPSRLARALRVAGLEVVVAGPAAAPLTFDMLDGYRAVVLENVPALDLPDGGNEALASWVRDTGGGLLMTGGQASYGPGGYYRTPIERVLPVTMEVRQEQRRFALAMAIALDRSGSMAAPVGPVDTKMDLANRGTIAAIELLGYADSVAVIAVDSTDHTVVPMGPLTDKFQVIGKVRTIESSGGGIFVFTALTAMAKQLAKADQATKHMVLFADAADAEEPGDYEKLVPKLRQAGVTLSVIGLGGPNDKDAEFLRDLARLGGGRCEFVDDPQKLPQVFAQETIQVARSSFASEPVGVRVLPDVLAVGELHGGSFPAVGGYSIAYLEAGAAAGLVTEDDIAAPLLSFWQHGLGRSAAYLGEVDGEHSGELAQWDGFADFFVTVVRWLSGSHADETVWANLERQGHRAVLTVEVAEVAEDAIRDLEVLVRGPDGAVPVWLRRVDDRRLVAELPLESHGVYRAVVRVGEDRIVRVPPVTLPYSPEFEPRADPASGEKLLRRLAEITEGRVDPPTAELFAGRRDSFGLRPIAEWCAWAAVLLLLCEIAVRRLEWSPRLGRVSPRRLWAAVRRALPASRPPKPVPEARDERPASAAADPSSETPGPETGPAPEPEARPDQAAGIHGVLERARARAKRRR